MIYLNNSSTSHPKPDTVNGKIVSYMTTFQENSERIADGNNYDTITNARQTVADFFNFAEINNVIFTSGATESLNMIINGIDWQNGNIITSVTEHNSVLRPLQTLEQNKKISLTVVECDQFGIVDVNSIESAILENTKAIIINHISNVTGAIQDIAAISQIAKQHGCLFIVDAAQSAGATYINMQEIKIDILAFAGHKSIMGLAGCGGLLVRDAKIIKPMKSGGTGTNTRSKFQPENMPTKLEAGTPNYVGIVSITAGIDWIKSIGLNELTQYKENIFKQFYHELSGVKNIVLYNQFKNNSFQNITFNIGEIPPDEIAYILNSSFDIVVRAGLLCAPLIHKYIGTNKNGCLRISPSYFTTNKEINIAISAIKQIAKNYL